MDYVPMNMDSIEGELWDHTCERATLDEHAPETYAFAGLLASYLALKKTSNANEVGTVVLTMIHALGYEIRKPVEEA